MGLQQLLDEFVCFHVDKTELNSSYHKLKDICFEIADKHLQQIKRYQLPENKSLFRVRKNNGKKPFNNTSELFAPPPSSAEIGRFNLNAHPIFYCSDNSTTSILESKCEEGDYITLINHTVKKELNLFVLGDCKRYHTINEQNEDLLLFYKFITKIVCDQVTLPYNYLKTATLGHVLLSDRNYDGIMYPSIYSKYQGDNFAIQIDGLSKILSFNEARQFKVIKKYNINHIVVACMAKSIKTTPENIFVWDAVEDCKTHEILFDEKGINLE